MINYPSRPKTRPTVPKEKTRRPSTAREDRDDEDDLPPRAAKKAKRVMETPRLKEPERPAQRSPKARRAEEELRGRGFVIDEDEVASRLPKKIAKRARNTAVVASEVVSESSRELTLTTDKQIRRAVISSFGDKAGTVLEMLEVNDSDGAISLLSRSLIQMLIGVLPLAEANVQQSKGQRGIYQLNQLVSGIREMMVDLNNLRDKGDLGRSIVERYLRPSYQELGAQLAVMFNAVIDQARNRMTPEDFREYRLSVEGSRNDLAKFMLAQYEDVKEGVASALS